MNCEFKSLSVVVCVVIICFVICRAQRTVWIGTSQLEKIDPDGLDMLNTKTILIGLDVEQWPREVN